MASLHDFLSYFVSGLDDLCKQASDLHTTADNSAKTFYSTGEQLNGSIEGKGADAFFNVFALNNQRCQLLIDKANDYYNAADALRKGLDEVTDPYDDYHNSKNGLMWRLDAGGEQYTNMTAREIWERLRTAFATNANLDNLINQSTAAAAISGPLNAERDQILREIDSHFREPEDSLNKTLKEVPDKDDPTHQNADNLLRQLQDQKSAAHSRVQTIVNDLQTNLEEWSLSLTALVQTFINEVNTAAKIDKYTISDLIYEANLPQNANTPVIIEQLPNGGLLVLVKGGNKEQVEGDIQQFLHDHGYSGQNPSITLIGYGNGEAVAQQVAQDAHARMQDGSKLAPLPFQITQIVMVGNNLPDPDGLPSNYIAYQTMPEEDKRPWYEPTPEQTAIMGLTLLLAIPTEGGSLLLEGEEITGSVIIQAAGKEGVTKIEEYAVALGYNSTHPELQSEADFLAAHLKNYGHFGNQITFSVNGGKTVLTPDDYHALYPDPTKPPKNLQVYYRGVAILPEQSGLKPDLSNDGYLSTQVVPNP